MQSIPSNETLIENKICTHCGISYSITDKDIEFLTRLAPTIAGKVISLPSPTQCPHCRKFERLAWRNEKKLYKRKCDATGEDIISLFPPTAKNPVYKVDVWNSDSWDAKKYGRDFDFSLSFLEQFGQLMGSIPLPSSSIGPGVENSEYSGACSWIKDCYLTFSANKAEKVHYSVDVVDSSHSVDCLGIMNAENCYECVEVYNSYDIAFAYNVKNSRNSSFILDCDGCHDCYGSFGLKNSSYYIFNTPYSEAEYLEKISEIRKQTLTEQKEVFKQFCAKNYIKTALPNIGSENIVESENVIDSQNISFSRHIRGAQDVRYSQKFQLPGAHLCMDSTSIGNNTTRIYSTYQGLHNSHNLYFCAGSFNEVSHLFYSTYCRNGTNHCFGCVGLRHGESYCILNKQYTKDEYEELVPKIIEKMQKDGEWGQFFPARYSPLGYDDSVCQILHPLTEDQAKDEGFNWSGYESPFPKVEKTIQANLLGEDITKIPDDILNWAILCEVTGKPFRIIKQELEFYRKHNLPIPKRHPDQRYLDRLEWSINY